MKHAPIILLIALVLTGCSPAAGGRSAGFLAAETYKRPELARQIQHCEAWCVRSVSENHPMLCALAKQDPIAAGTCKRKARSCVNHCLLEIEE